MKVLVTGSSGHLGEALMRTLRRSGIDAVGLDITPSAHTTVVGSICDRECVKSCLRGVAVVYHTATLHKPHVVTHRLGEFVETNIQGTLTLLEEAVTAGVGAFVYTSTTSVFGDALRPTEDQPAAWVTEDLRPIPRNVYGVSKAAAEDFCHLISRKRGLNCIVLRTSRFFPEEDDDKERRDGFADANLKVNEYLYRRVDIEDLVGAHLLAAECAPKVAFGRYIVTATSPFSKEDLGELRSNVSAVLQRKVPEFLAVYKSMGWRMLEGLDRVYVNDAARRDLGWTPRFTFPYILNRLRKGKDFRSETAIAVGSKGYHAEVFSDGPFPV